MITFIKIRSLSAYDSKVITFRVPSRSVGLCVCQTGVFLCQRPLLSFMPKHGYFPGELWVFCCFPRCSWWALLHKIAVKHHELQRILPHRCRQIMRLLHIFKNVSPLSLQFFFYFYFPVCFWMEICNLGFYFKVLKNK